MRLTQLTIQLKNKVKGVQGMMINFYAMQVENGWISLEQVPKKYRPKVKQLLEQAHAGLGDEVATEKGV